jgi:hypothetical protein
VLTTILDSILDHQKRLHRPVASLLQPGLSENAIRDLFRTVSIRPPQALVDLYCWRNGIPEETKASLNDLNFIPGYYFMGLQEAVATYRILTTPYPDVVWNPLYFPFLADGSDGRYAVHCGDSDRLLDGDVTWTLCGETRNVYESLKSMLMTVEDCYASGAFFVANGSLRVDARARAKIAQRHNPSVAYWQRPMK